MTKLARITALSLGLLCALATVAAAHGEDPQETARAHYEAGHALYRVGNYAQAAKEFTAAFELTRRPQLLINAGLAYGKDHDPRQARACFEQFLSIAPASDPDRESVNRLIADLPPPPPPGATVGTVSPGTTITQPPPKKRSFARRHWWIFPVVGVAAAGLATGLYFALRPRCGAGLGCVEFP